MSNSRISSSYGSTGPQGGLSMYEHKNRPTPQDKPLSVEHGTGGGGLNSSLSKPHTKRTVRKTPFRTMPLAASSLPPEKKSAVPPSHSHESGLTVRDEVGKPQFTETDKTLGEWVEIQIVLLSLEPQDTLLDAQARFAWLLQDIGNSKEAVLKYVSTQEVVNKFLQANPCLMWSLPPNDRSVKHYFDFAQRWERSLDDEVANQFDEMFANDERQRDAAWALLNTAREKLRDGLSAEGVAPEDFYGKALSKDSSAVCHVPEAHRTREACQSACAKNPSFVRYIPDSLLSDKEFLRLAIKFAYQSLVWRSEEFVHWPETLKRQPDLAAAAAMNCPQVLEQIKPELFGPEIDGQYRRVCEMAVYRDPAAIKFVEPNSLSQSMIYRAIRKDVELLDCIPVGKIKEKRWPQLIEIFFRENAYKQLDKVPDKVFKTVCLDRIAHHRLHLEDLARYVSLPAKDRGGAYSEARAKFILEIFISQIRFDAAHARCVPEVLKPDVAAAFPGNKTVLEILYPPQEHHDTNSCSIS